MTTGALALAVALALGGGPALPPDADEIAIEATGLRPGSLRTTVERRVVFVNRTGRPVHVELLGEKGHHIVQVPGRVWAVFHQPGRHEYVVHFASRGARNLRGAVIVEDVPGAARELPTCTTVTVMGVCIEP